MSLPVFSFVSNVTTNITICQIVAVGSVVAGATAGSPKIFLQTTQQNQSPMLDLCNYFIAVGSSGVGTIITFQELGADGTWRALVNPAPITGANSTSYNPGATATTVLSGPFHGLRLSISGVVGNGVAYAELRGAVRQI